ncbi:MAG: hypothetical protein BAJATHORv1_10588 [Candidatus Thorarchaeota archaeon]|nr:MAG: hypothetical protein BAJATHORv1_10588 [Candidatus Thorarchaeota archaeon]
MKGKKAIHGRKYYCSSIELYDYKKMTARREMKIFKPLVGFLARLTTLSVIAGILFP